MNKQQAEAEIEAFARQKEAKTIELDRVSAQLRALRARELELVAEINTIGGAIQALRGAFDISEKKIRIIDALSAQQPMRTSMFTKEKP